MACPLPTMDAQQWEQEAKMRATIRNTSGLVERDPNGRRANEPGAKLDSGKSLPHLVLSEFSLALDKVVEVGTYGANKYTPRGWVSVPNGVDRYTEAASRHMLAMWQGEVINEKDGGLEHEAQFIWNLLAAYELKLRKEKPTCAT